jgi:hypothetical protein
MIKKLFRDLWATLYDDQEYMVISLPRTAFALSIVVFCTAWIADQFFGFEYKNMNQLLGFVTTCGGAYAAKKFVDGKGGNGNV